MLRHGGFAFALVTGGLAWAISVTYFGFTSDPRSQFTGLEHLSIFQRVKSQNDHSTRPVQEVEAVSTDAEPRTVTAPSRRAVPNASSFDMGATASIPDQRRRGDSPAGLAIALSDHTLLTVSGDRALIQSGDALRSVTQGDVLGAAGAVLSIQRRGGEWVVITEGGVIRSQRPK